LRPLARATWSAARPLACRRIQEGRAAHAARGGEIGREFLEHQEDLAVVGAGLVARVDVNGADLAGVLAAVEVGPGGQMRVVEAQARGPGREGLAAHAVRRDVGRALLGGAVDDVGQELAVPVQLLGRVRVVVDVDDALPAFLEAHQRSGEAAIIGGRREEEFRCVFDQAGADANGVVGRAAGRHRGGGCADRRRRLHRGGRIRRRRGTRGARHHAAQRGQPAQLEEVAAIRGHSVNPIQTTWPASRPHIATMTRKTVLKLCEGWRAQEQKKSEHPCGCSDFPAIAATRPESRVRPRR
jgi:hypothetical protein